MTRQQIFEELRRTLVEGFELEAEQVTLEARLGDDLDLDSIDAIDLIVKMEEIVGRRIDQDAFKKVASVGDVVEVVHRQLARSA